MNVNLECKNCAFVGRNTLHLGQHIRRVHGNVKLYYEKYYPKKCKICQKKLPYKNRGLQRYFEAIFCSKTCCGKGPTGMQFGAKHRNWKGGRVSVDGYTLRKLASIPQEDWKLIKSMLRRANYVAEHRYVMAKKLGRALKRHEVVHHINGIRNDNSLENLELWIEAHPRGVNAKDLCCPNCGFTLAAKKNDA